MIKKLYVSNFKCFTDAEISFDSINLLIGKSGTGKSSIFEVLYKIKTFISGVNIDKVFIPKNICRLQDCNSQKFKLEVEGNGGIYTYDLCVSSDKKGIYLEQESLLFNGSLLINYEYKYKVLQFYDDYCIKNLYLTKILSILNLYSNASQEIRWFVDYITQKLIILKIDPNRIFPISIKKEKNILINADNFVSWYRYQDKQKIIIALRNIIENFDTFMFDAKSGIFKVVFNINDKLIFYDFEELSDGQKTLIVLYSIIHTYQDEGYTLCIDEPENFIELPEINHLLNELNDYSTIPKSQVFIISHHPEWINYLAVSSGYWFDFEINGAVQIKRITEDDSGLPISEVVLRGWINF